MPPRTPPPPSDLPTMTVVQSSILFSIGYDEPHQVLFVRFRLNPREGRPQPGALYRYLRVPRTIWRRFEKAPSAGQYFLTRVKDKFGYSKWTGRGWRGETALRADTKKRAAARLVRALLNRKAGRARVG